MAPYNSRLKNIKMVRHRKCLGLGKRTRPFLLLLAREAFEFMEARVLDPSVESVEPEEPALVLVPQLDRLLAPKVPVGGHQPKLGTADMGYLQEVKVSFSWEVGIALGIPLGDDLDDRLDIETGVIFLVDFLKVRRTMNLYSYAFTCHVRIICISIFWLKFNYSLLVLQVQKAKKFFNIRNLKNLS